MIAVQSSQESSGVLRRQRAEAKTVNLFLTCLGENFFSPVLKDLVTLLERLGVRCEVPEGQTCCGQPFFNSGYQTQAIGPARQWLKVFGRTHGYIVAPSGSCVEFVRHRYPELFPFGTPEHALAQDISHRTLEFTEFLTKVLKVTDVGASFPHRVTYHASCHLLRGLGLRDEPKQLSAAVRGLEYIPLPAEETCCGFGGIFSVVYPEVSRSISHIIAPAVHLTKEGIAELFRAKLGVDAPAEPVQLAAIARARLREAFLAADMGISGANFMVAETGTLVIVSNEGNGRMCTTLPPLHVAVVGIDKVVPDMESLDVLLKLLPRSATGQKMTCYTSFITGPSRNPEEGGPQELHLVLLDNGRTRVLRDVAARETCCAFAVVSV